MNFRIIVTIFDIFKKQQKGHSLNNRLWPLDWLTT